MDLTRESKACCACARAKRKCGKQIPTLDVSIPSSIASLDPKSSAPPLPWYLAPDSWNFDHLDASNHGPPCCSDVLNSFIKKFQEWLVTWNRTPENKAIIAALVEERMKQLRNDQPTPISGAEDNSSFLALTPFEHLARVHALLVYQAIGLYDGDIRLRHVAETQVPTLNSWLRQLIKSAQSAAREGPEKFIHSLLFPSSQTQRGPILSHSTTRPSPDVGVMTNISAGSILSPEDIAWYAWLFAETIRRTWLAACTIQTVYLTLQVGWAPCPGGVPITARDGLFSADSAYAWASKCGGTEKHEQAETDFVRRGQSSWIFEQRSPEDVDEFARLSLEITFGLERVERWRIMKGAKGADMLLMMSDRITVAL
ncbi:hypothetical protein VSDG_07260 [Cytospora chrysosperma]|uniref:Transcription factor domain-containing protein n=1 Tax=Cytospora chrysosperma TaxID=252740 RepID=A0A423VMV1_CYTCH|nr:hypothetical protein VSDG_07260 [Valsa sordida]